MQRVLRLISVLSVGVLAACAVGDITAPTDTPPLTLPAPPTPIFTGACDNTAELEDWAQSAVYLTRDFVAVMNDAREQTRGQMYHSVVRLAEMRDVMSAAPAPDCAADAQRALLDVMIDATATLQRFANNELDNIASDIVDLNARFDEAIAMQDELVVRLDQQARQPAP